MHSKSLSTLLFILLAPLTLGQPDKTPQDNSAIAVADSDTLVSIAPCRVMDTAMQASTEGEASEAGRVDVRASRCGRIIPSYATAYSVRLTRIVRGAPEKQQEGSMPVIETSRKVPVPNGDSVLQFATPPSQHVSVDIDGYYVPAGVPIWPSGTSFAAGGQGRVVQSQAAPGAPVSTVTTTGSTGSFYLDGLAPGLSRAGVAFTAVAANPWVIARTGSAASNSGFAVVNSAARRDRSSRRRRASAARPGACKNRRRSPAGPCSPT